MRIKDISKWERPRERFRIKGADVLSNAHKTKATNFFNS